ncbi:hypothetical protein QUB33_27125 [Microcoleus sp. B3-A4]|uniref:hypothetical protein n=1 Tax=Microcoleus sp. B3-A4 TaxID=2818653 RepID=UPI002FD0AC2F
MAIPSVMQGLIETEDGKVFELDSPKGAAWLESIGSFRYEPTGDGKAYTVRKEASSYWYGCRKVAGKVRKKYIGKSSEVSIAKLEEIAEALETPPVPRVAEVTEQVAESAAEIDFVPNQAVAESRVTALEAQVAELLKAVKDIQEALPGKSDAGNSVELPKVDNEVVERLQNELSNLQAEREDVARIKTDLKEAAAELHREQRATELEKARWQQELSDARCELADAKTTLLKQADKIRELERGYSLKPNPAESRLRLEIGELNQQLADLKQKSATAGKDFPDAAEVYNQFKAKNPKAKMTFKEALPLLATAREMMEES